MPGHQRHWCLYMHVSARKSKGMAWIMKLAARDMWQYRINSCLRWECGKRPQNCKCHEVARPRTNRSVQPSSGISTAPGPAELDPKDSEGSFPRFWRPSLLGCSEFFFAFLFLSFWSEGSVPTWGRCPSPSTQPREGHAPLTSRASAFPLIPQSHETHKAITRTICNITTNQYLCIYIYPSSQRTG